MNAEKGNLTLRNKPLDIRRERAIKYMKKFGITIEDPEEFQGIYSYLHFKCPKGHRFYDKYSNVYYRENKCLTCAKLKEKTQMQEIIESAKNINDLYSNVMDKTFELIDQFCEKFGRNDELRTRFYKGAEIVAKAKLNRGEILKPNILAAIGVYIFEPILTQDEVGAFFNFSSVSMRNTFKRLFKMNSKQFRKRIHEILVR